MDAKVEAVKAAKNDPELEHTGIEMQAGLQAAHARLQARHPSRAQQPAGAR